MNNNNNCRAFESSVRDCKQKERGDSPKEIPRKKKDENRRILLMLRVHFATALESSAIFLKRSSKYSGICCAPPLFFSKSLHSTMGWALFVRFFKVGPAYPSWGCLHTQRKVSFLFPLSREAAVAKCQLTTEEENTRAHGFPQNWKKHGRKRREEKKSFITPA